MNPSLKGLWRMSRSEQDPITPRELGYAFPAEFAPQRAMWLSWPHKEESWPGKIHTIYKVYCEFIRIVAQDQQVCINVADGAMRQFAAEQLSRAGCPLANIKFYYHPTNDAWCRDHGPAFLVKEKGSRGKDSPLA